MVPLLGEGGGSHCHQGLKKEGDFGKELEPLLEVNTDKVDTEIPAPATGTVLKIMAEEGVPAKVGAVLAFIGKAEKEVRSEQWRISKSKSRKSKVGCSSVIIRPVTQSQGRLCDFDRTGLYFSRCGEDRGGAWGEFAKRLGQG
ncbi:MAG: biotin/lipoyl-containing protein [Anaerolineales bacterium]